ncbi:HmuY family protein [uncultured Proteiniphilum sp.]|uniref:HmuY family protein n=1 Tax=uncultured Proteiniphilum sp. TaxID=497637 RepID=UPI002622563B|nr:HmuY family protein [uncultured Proteiniphilum sp.]
MNGQFPIQIRNKKELVVIAFLSSVVLSCDKEEDSPALIGEVKGFKYLVVNDLDKWVYFSFEKGDIVEVENHETNLSWDLGFHRSEIRTNGGKSGRGEGGVIKMETTDWNAVTEVPENVTFSLDEEVELTGYPTMQEKTLQSYSTVFKWVNVIPPMNPPTYDITMNIFIVRSANGNYAKIQVYDRYNERNEGGYVSFKYQYNKDGGKKIAE